MRGKKISQAFIMCRLVQTEL